MRPRDPLVAVVVFLALGVAGAVVFALALLHGIALIRAALSGAPAVAVPDTLPLLTSTILLPVMAFGVAWSLARPLRSRQVRTASFLWGLGAAIAVPLATWAALTWTLAQGGYAACPNPTRQTFSTLVIYAAPGAACR